MSVDAAALGRFCPAAVAFHAGIDAATVTFEINTPLRLAHFLAQCAHESGGFKLTVENLNYSAESLRKVFGKYFPDEATASQYARAPEKIANRVYASRMGNGYEHSGDGWKYRGRGLIQLTGHDNYASYSLAVYRDARILDAPDALTRDPDAVLSAAWFWKSRTCNSVADRDDLVAITKIVNGGTNGLDDRAQWLSRAKQEFCK